jgi:hypothetical protein
MKKLLVYILWAITTLSIVYAGLESGVITGTSFCFLWGSCITSRPPPGGGWTGQWADLTFFAPLFSPADNSTYVFAPVSSLVPLTISNDRPSRRTISPITGYITSLTVMSSVAGIFATSENITIIVHNYTQWTNYTGTTTYWLNSLALISTSRLDMYPINLQVNAGDQISIRLKTPAWSVNPEDVIQMYTVHIQ